MKSIKDTLRVSHRDIRTRYLSILTVFAVMMTGFYACSSTEQMQAPAEELLTPIHEVPAPSEDPRVGLSDGLFDALKNC